MTQWVNFKMWMFFEEFNELCIDIDKYNASQVRVIIECRACKNKRAFWIIWLYVFLCFSWYTLWSLLYQMETEYHLQYWYAHNHIYFYFLPQFLQLLKLVLTIKIFSNDKFSMQNTLKDIMILTPSEFLSKIKRVHMKIASSKRKVIWN